MIEKTRLQTQIEAVERDYDNQIRFLEVEKMKRVQELWRYHIQAGTLKQDLEETLSIGKIDVKAENKAIDEFNKVLYNASHCPYGNPDCDKCIRKGKFYDIFMATKKKGGKKC